ncbi:uncharacterized protein LOC112184201 [Rosa chinensis]|uniref:uncharacterized protein LOC112184201 n=1 Tax=Rosa chinensis TaxID=74649 RepID=UPI000D0918E7|nr:uncharacterized protein LOC112184201 [Rosa chinensis]
MPHVPCGGIGGVLKNSQGLFIAAFSHRVNFVCSPLHAELLTLKHGLLFLQDMQVTETVVESDYLIAVGDINNEVEDLSSLSALITEVKDLVRFSNDVCIRHASSQANTVSHRLASHSFDSNVHHERFVNAPDLILDTLMYDLPRTH